MNPKKDVYRYCCRCNDGRNAFARQTYGDMECLTVNEQVTTVITATEPIRFVDISTKKDCRNPHQ